MQKHREAAEAPRHLEDVTGNLGIPGRFKIPKRKKNDGRRILYLLYTNILQITLTNILQFQKQYELTVTQGHRSTTEASLYILKLNRIWRSNIRWYFKRQLFSPILPGVQRAPERHNLTSPYAQRHW